MSDNKETTARVLGAIHDFAAMKPEDGETWESWYAAAFDLLGDKVGELLGASTIERTEKQAPAVEAIKFFLNAGRDSEFLECWAYGEWDYIRKEWPEAPESVFPTDAALARVSEAPAHTDDAAVDSFARAMKDKMARARAKGRSGWEGMEPAELSRMLRAHVEKGDPRDVANFCMMLWHHSSGIVRASEAAAGEPVATVHVPSIKGGLEVGAPIIEFSREFEARMDAAPNRQFQLYAAPQPASEQHGVSRCARCNSSTAQGCNDMGCGYLEGSEQQAARELSDEEILRVFSKFTLYLNEPWQKVQVARALFFAAKGGAHV